MSKYCGKIGFAEMVETEPGVWEEVITERGPYYGDIVRNTRRNESSQYLNDNVNISNRFSIMSDAYAREKFHTMRYLYFYGEKWKIVSAEIDYPRLMLEVGGLYNDGQ